jgi:membrane protein implicated in regulation of membrane protease activity
MFIVAMVVGVVVLVVEIATTGIYLRRFPELCAFALALLLLLKSGFECGCLQGTAVIVACCLAKE